jgi:4-hydroxybutyrate CoA-transferase
MCAFVTYTSQVTSPLLIPVKKGDSFYDNPTVEFHPSDRTNDTSLIRQNDKMVAINSALEIDLTGQVCADSFGHRIYSGIGGQMDFIHGAALSKGGKPVIALPSTAAKGTVSRIVPELKPGAGLVTTRGARALGGDRIRRGKPTRKDLVGAGKALISIAHPDFRSDLRKALANIRHFVLR